MAEFRLSNFTSGAVLTAVELNTGLTYATYTPVWVQGAKTITHTLDWARFTQFGKYVSGTVKMTSTTTGAGTTSIHQVTLPVEANSNNNVFGAGWVSEVRPGGSIQYPLISLLLNVTNTQFIRTDSTIKEFFNRNTNVEFWELYFNFMYEAA